MKKGKRWTALLLCGTVAAGGILYQMVPAAAERECTCEIQVHGSNCPLSLCSCAGAETGEHTEDCRLSGKNSDLTACVCVPDIHAEGCPRYEAEGASIALLSETAQTTEDADGEASESTADQSGDDMEGGSASASREEAGEDDAAEENTREEAAEETDEGNAESESEAAGSSETQDPVTESTGSGSTESGSDAGTARDPDTEPLEVEVPEDLDAMEEDWEYPSGWSGYGDGQMEGNLPVAAEAYALELQLQEHILEVQGLLTNGENARLSEAEEGFGDILAVYAVLSGKTEDYPYGASLEDASERELFCSVYWSMTQVTGVSNAQGAAVSVYRLSIEEAAKLYGFTDTELEAALSLAEQGDTVDEVVQESIFASLTEEGLQEVLELVPEDLSVRRRSVLLAAVSLDGKVDYFWGGKSLSYGWDDRWGELRTVASEGSSTYGTARPFGLDCSGFVSWAFLNAFGSEDSMGDGTTGQWSVSEAVEWEDAVPGDLVFYYSPDSGSTNHVGIVLTVDEDGPETVVHCSSSKGVNISGADGFSYVRRPLVYTE